MKNKFEKLKIENNDQKINTKKTLDTFDNISAESKRVSKIALNANIIISDLDRQFETATRLKKIDMSFLFLATGMHIVRQHLQNNYFTDGSRKTDKEAAGESNYRHSPHRRIFSGRESKCNPNVTRSLMPVLPDRNRLSDYSSGTEE